MPERAVRALRAELEAGVPDVWPRVARTLLARRIAAELLAVLNRPPSPHSRLGWELRLRIDRSFARREAA